MFSRIITLFSLIFLLIACSKDQEYDKTKAISAFVIIDSVAVDKSLEKTSITPPQQKNNTTWMAASNAEIENFAKNFSYQKKGFFSSEMEISLQKKSQSWFFYSGDLYSHFVFAPIIKDGKVFIFDTAATLVCRDLKTGKKIWKSQVFAKNFLKNYKTPKIFAADGKIFAVAGINKVAALSEVDGKILWTKEIASIPSSAPVSDGKFVYVSSNDNKTYALDAATGDLTWVQSGIVRTTAIFGFANPVILKDLLIVSYSSGEIYALKKSSGEAIWSQDLNLSKATTSDFYLNDVDATPIVKNDVIYAIGNGGLMMAVKVKDGNYLWKKEIAGLTDFWLAGDFLFVINNDNKLLAVSKKTGGIKWISQLPNLAKEKKPQTKFIYSGVVMAGDKLLISRLDGALLIASPLDGTLEKTFKINKKISHAPAVVDGKIYLQAIGKYVIDLLEIE
jgi:outer membrane protein assembly factor BamB